MGRLQPRGVTDMRTLAIVGISLAVVGVVFYWKRDAIEDWASTFAATAAW